MLAEAVLMIVLGILRVLRKSKSEGWCETKLVGPLRDSVGIIVPANVRVLNNGAAVIERGTAREMALDILRAHCRQCAGCSLADK